MATSSRSSASSRDRTKASRNKLSSKPRRTTRKPISAPRNKPADPKPRSGARIEYRIYPSIGIARTGDSSQGFFVGPESPGSLPQGPYRDADGIRPQGARFRIYRVEIDANENETATAEILPGRTVKIEWSVQLANTKAAAMKIQDTLARKTDPTPRNDGFTRSKLVISAQGKISGKKESYPIWYESGRRPCFQ